MKKGIEIIRKTKLKESFYNYGILIIIIASVGIMFLNINSVIASTVIYSLIMIPLAILLGKNTSKITDYIGEKRGGLVSATAGNIPELMMGLWSIRYGMVNMAKAGLLGSVITNMLLGLGISVFLGGIKYKEQTFNKNIAKTNINMIFLVAFTIIIVSALSRYSIMGDEKFKNLSILASIVLMGVYILGLIFSLFTHSNLFILNDDNSKEENTNYQGIGRILGVIALITVLLYFISEKLVSNINSIVIDYKISQEFIGMILIPILGSFGENVTSIVCALENKINASLETAIGSSIQITMFVIPILVISSAIMGIYMDLLFSTFQIIIMTMAMGMSYFVFQDGKTYWFEGALLIAVYIIVTLAYYYIV